jgi:hypothetical protein
VLATTVSVTEEEKREILMNNFMLIPSTDATAGEHARHRRPGPRRPFDGLGGWRLWRVAALKP